MHQVPGSNPGRCKMFFFSFHSIWNFFCPWAKWAQGLLIESCFQPFGDNNLTTKTAGGPRGARYFSEVVKAPECLFVWLLQDFWSLEAFLCSCKSSSMSIKLVNIFVWLLQHPWSVWRSQTLFWSCRSSTMSDRLVNIFVWLVQHPWSVWRSQTLF